MERLQIEDLIIYTAYQDIPLMFLSDPHLKYFWITCTSSLFLKASLRAHSFKWKLDFIHKQIKLVNFYKWLCIRSTN